MRSTIIAVMLSVAVPALPACGGTVASEASSPPPATSAAAGGGAGGGDGQATEPSGGGGAGSEGGTNSASASSGASWSGAQPTCVFGVTGAVDAWVAGPDAQGWAWWLGASQTSVQCSGSVLGFDHEFSVLLPELHGPGQYHATSAVYERFACGGASGCSDMENYTPKSSAADCTFEITVAPHKLAVGVTIAGSFYCSPLAEGSDPTRVVTIYDGSFTAAVLPQPD